MRYRSEWNGSSASRNASPRLLNASTDSRTIAPGNRARSGRFQMKFCAPLSMLPQVGVGGWIPSPRYDSADSVRIAFATPSDAETMIAGIAWGRTWRRMIRSSRAPSVRAAVTNSCGIVRSEVLRTVPQEFVTAARTLGAPDRRILWRHVLPQAMPSIIVAASLGVANAILTESALSFLGLGIQPPTPTWGNMLSGAQNFIWNKPDLALYPGLMILLAVLAFNSLGDAVRDALDPFQSRR